MSFRSTTGSATSWSVPTLKSIERCTNQYELNSNLYAHPHKRNHVKNPVDVRLSIVYALDNVFTKKTLTHFRCALN